MIIECINCNKKFNVNSELIPENMEETFNVGRVAMFGSSKKNQQNEFYKPIIDKKVEINPKTLETNLKSKLKNLKNLLQFSKKRIIQSIKIICQPWLNTKTNPLLLLAIFYLIF